ncbi:MAG: VacJ family lipoprotein [Nitrospiraceae bacterium]|nr:VacJ family lipoprotein [Nitrospiraceae bacterium]
MMIQRDGLTNDRKKPCYEVLIGLALMGLTGCAGQNSVAMLPVPTPQEFSPVSVTSQIAAASKAAPAPDAGAPQPVPDDFDPFATPGEEGLDEYDPWEPVNAKIFEFNRQFDRYVLKPVATGYNFVVPNPVQVGVSNFFYNLRFPPRFLNNVFQGKVKGAGIEAGRFLVNSTVGVGGLFDVAEHLDLKTPEEDTGQTLGFYGVGPGPFVVLPLMPPFTVRDLVGYVGDIFMNPINWLVAPLIEVEGVPSAIPHKNRTTTTFIQTGGRIFEIVNERSLNLEKFQGVEEATLDLYTAVRNAYLQRRAKAIRE